MSWFLKWAGWQAYAVFAAALASLGLVWWGQVVYLRSQINTATAATQQAETALSARVTAEAVAVAEAVAKARSEERAKQKSQEKKYAELVSKSANLRTERDAAVGRLRVAAESAGGAAGGGHSACTDPAPKPANTSADELRAADGILIDRLLRLAEEAESVAAERNWVVDQYITNCEQP